MAPFTTTQSRGWTLLGCRGQGEDCHEGRREIEKVLYRKFGIEHTTLQVDHVGDHAAEGQRLQFLPQIRKRNTR